ncbi:hypothetical protein [Acetonema longum]|uniref:Lipoprotein n=1 Tax=Acetonema longum DSM 6540 TaxID=1009370 RepID=F7NII4_9FIRM|nr:hypothetical protein [Acetonema longum]EGO64130.1 hypothetical protein ALO_09434 [Acetonema longum DSM 6540]
MKKIALVLLTLFAMTLLITGCGGGSGDGGGTKGVTSSFVVTDYTGKKNLPGVKFYYEAPDGTPGEATSDENGAFTTFTTQVGNYKLTHFIYEGETYTAAFVGRDLILQWNGQSEINNNVKVKYKITIESRSLEVKRVYF